MNRKQRMNDILEKRYNWCVKYYMAGENSSIAKMVNNIQSEFNKLFPEVDAEYSEKFIEVLDNERHEELHKIGLNADECIKVDRRLCEIYNKYLETHKPKPEVDIEKVIEKMREEKNRSKYKIISMGDEFLGMFANFIKENFDEKGD